MRLRFMAERFGFVLGVTLGGSSSSGGVQPVWLDFLVCRLVLKSDMGREVLLLCSSDRYVLRDLIDGAAPFEFKLLSKVRSADLDSLRIYTPSGES